MTGSQPAGHCMQPARCQRVGPPEEGGEVASLHQLCDHTQPVVVPERLVVAQQGGVVEGGQQANLLHHRRPVSGPQRGAVCELQSIVLTVNQPLCLVAAGGRAGEGQL
jgi:hypothetical protein